MDGRLRDLARHALTADTFDRGAALRALSDEDRRFLPETVSKYKQSLRPLRAIEPTFEGSETRKVKDAFRPIGAKMRPDMSEEQAGYWTSAIIIALSDLPPWIAVQALSEAVHKPFDFPTDMEAGVREIADRKLDGHKRALARLELLLDQLRGRDERPLEIEASAEPLTLDEIRAMYRGPCGESLVRMGVKTGAIREADLALVLAQDGFSESVCEKE